VAKQVPKLLFRVEPGYTFEEDVSAPKLQSDNIIVGHLNPSAPPESFFIGKVAEYGTSRGVWLDYDAAHAIYIVGKRRSGKTYTLGVVMEGLVSNSWLRQGATEEAVLMLDTMNTFITMPHNVDEVFGEASEQFQEFKKWRLESERLNIVFFYPRGIAPPPEGASRQISIRPSDLDDKDWAALFGLDTYSDPMGQLISDVYERVALNGYRNLNGQQLNPNQSYSIDDLLNCIEMCGDISAGYHQETIRGVQARLRAIRRQAVISDEGVDVRDLFVPGRLSILLLRDIDQDLRSLLVGVLVKKIMQFRSISDRFERLLRVHLQRIDTSTKKGDHEQAAKSKSKAAEYEAAAANGLPRGWIIIDEAHNYMPAKGITPSSAPLKKYVNEGRNLGLSVVMATQNPSGLEPSIRRNADILIIHSLSMREDIVAVEGMANTLIPSAFEFGQQKVSTRAFEQLVRSLPMGYAVISSDVANRVFVLRIRPRTTVHGGFEY